MRFTRVAWVVAGIASLVDAVAVNPLPAPTSITVSPQKRSKSFHEIYFKTNRLLTLLLCSGEPAVQNQSQVTSS
jgi:hypothetical protein